MLEAQLGGSVRKHGPNPFARLKRAHGFGLIIEKMMF